MGRKVYTPQRERTFHNGKFYEANKSTTVEETDFCNACDALTLHVSGLCARCYPGRTSQNAIGTNLTKSGAANNKKNMQGREQ